MLVKMERYLCRCDATGCASTGIVEFPDDEDNPDATPEGWEEWPVDGEVLMRTKYMQTCSPQCRTALEAELKTKRGERW